MCVLLLLLYALYIHFTGATRYILDKLAVSAKFDAQQIG